MHPANAAPLWAWGGIGVGREPLGWGAADLWGCLWLCPLWKAWGASAATAASHPGQHRLCQVINLLSRGDQGEPAINKLPA